jgi:hypothetical protein
MCQGMLNGRPDVVALSKTQPACSTQGSTEPKAIRLQSFEVHSVEILFSR